MRDPTYKIGDIGSIHLLRDGQVRVQIGGGHQILRMDHFQFLLQFATATSAVEVGEVVVGLTPAEITTLIGEFQRRGLLQSMVEATTAAPEENFLKQLQPRYQSQEALRIIGQNLRAGRCVVLEDAFETSFAERAYAALADYTDWTISYANSSTFSYHHHKIPESAMLPDALHRCAVMFGSAATKELVGKLSNRDCGGDLAFGASLYLPGDYAMPHSDVWGLRNVTLNWYLTRDWSPAWGGQLHWCPSWQSLQPGFNTLALFNVSDENRHYVSHVAPSARGRRFTVNTWWLAASPETARRPVREREALAVAASGSPVPGITILG